MPKVHCNQKVFITWKGSVSGLMFIYFFSSVREEYALKVCPSISEILYTFSA